MGIEPITSAVAAAFSVWRQQIWLGAAMQEQQLWWLWAAAVLATAVALAWEVAVEKAEVVVVVSLEEVACFAEEGRGGGSAMLVACGDIDRRSWWRGTVLRGWFLSW